MPARRREAVDTAERIHINQLSVSREHSKILAKIPFGMLDLSVGNTWSSRKVKNLAEIRLQLINVRLLRLPGSRDFALRSMQWKPEGESSLPLRQYGVMLAFLSTCKAPSQAETERNERNLKSSDSAAPRKKQPQILRLPRARFCGHSVAQDDSAVERRKETQKAL